MTLCALVLCASPAEPHAAPCVLAQWLKTCLTEGIDHVPVANGGTEGLGSGGSLPGWAIALIVILALSAVVLPVVGYILYKRCVWRSRACWVPAPCPYAC